MYGKKFEAPEENKGKKIVFTGCYFGGNMDHKITQTSRSHNAEFHIDKCQFVGVTNQRIKQGIPQKNNNGFDVDEVTISKPVTKIVNVENSDYTGVAKIDIIQNGQGQGDGMVNISKNNFEELITNIAQK